MAHPQTDNPLGEELLEFIQRRLDESTLTFHTTLPPQRAQYAEWPEWVLPELKEKLVEGASASCIATKRSWRRRPGPARMR